MIFDPVEYFLGYSFSGEIKEGCTCIKREPSFKVFGKGVFDLSME